MVAQILGDQLFFVALTPQGRALDCGVLWRTPEAAMKPLDTLTTTWQLACGEATAWRAIEGGGKARRRPVE